MIEQPETLVADMGMVLARKPYMESQQIRNTKGGTRMKKLLAVCSLAVMLIGSMAFNATAAQINGGVSIDGGFSTNTAVGTNLNLATATALTFPSNGFVPASGGAGTFNLSALTAGTLVTMPGFTFTPFSGTPELWGTTISGITYELDLTSMTIVSQTSTALSLSGNGTFKETGFDNTPGIWNLTANTISGTASFSSSAGTVPEPTTLLLLGFGLVGLVGVARRRMK